MISSVDETGNSQSMTLVTGYESVRYAEPQLGRGALYQRARDALPDGPAHAVVPGERHSVCGKMMRTITGPWPPGMGSRCPECQEALSGPHPRQNE